MKKLLLLTLALAATSLLAVSTPEGTSWSGLDVDTTSQTRTLTPTYPIPYSTDWAKGSYDRKITVTAKQVDDASVAFQLVNTASEETGTYVWNYNSLSPEELPRTATYSLEYTIKSGSTTVKSGTSEASFTVLPEPGVMLLALVLGRGLLVKRF